MISGLIQKYLKLKSLRFAAEDIPVFDTNSLFLLVKCAVRVQLSVWKPICLDGFHSHLLCHRVVGQALDRP